MSVLKFYLIFLQENVKIKENYQGSQEHDDVVRNCVKGVNLHSINDDASKVNLLICSSSNSIDGSLEGLRRSLELVKGRIFFPQINRSKYLKHSSSKPLIVSLSPRHVDFVHGD